MPELSGSGEVLEIPMPGHPASWNEGGIQKLQNLIEAHDVVCMLTDSRESRWLPTLLINSINEKRIRAKEAWQEQANGVGSDGVGTNGVGTNASADPNLRNKNLILGVTVALGFDSFVVLTQSCGVAKRACYFCNDLTAPTDSMRDRTLDRQCTVVRPGVCGEERNF
jgi:ubiquitin-like modifier-activating enzyme ATG7